METNLLSSGNSMLLFIAFFLLLETMIIEIRGNQFKHKSIFLLVKTIFVFFCQNKQFFHIVRTYFSINTVFRVVETGFLASTDNKLVFRLEETYFLTKPSISGIGEGFFLYLKTIYFT